MSEKRESDGEEGGEVKEDELSQSLKISSMVWWGASSSVLKEESEVAELRSEQISSSMMCAQRYAQVLCSFISLTQYTIREEK